MVRPFRGGDILEIVDNHIGDRYRSVYTMRFPVEVYVLHAFQKKSKRGIATPRRELDFIKAAGNGRGQRCLAGAGKAVIGDG